MYDNFHWKQFYSKIYNVLIYSQTYSSWRLTLRTTSTSSSIEFFNFDNSSVCSRFNWSDSSLKKQNYEEFKIIKIYWCSFRSFLNAFSWLSTRVVWLLVISLIVCWSSFRSKRKLDISCFNCDVSRFICSNSALNKMNL